MQQTKDLKNFAFCILKLAFWFYVPAEPERYAHLSKTLYLFPRISVLIYISTWLTAIEKKSPISPLQKRQILVTLVEILLPLLFSGILIVLRQKVPFQDYPNATIYESFPVNILPSRISRDLQLGYVPSNSSVVRQVAEDVRGSLSLHSGG